MKAEAGTSAPSSSQAVLLLEELLQPIPWTVPRQRVQNHALHDRAHADLHARGHDAVHRLDQADAPAERRRHQQVVHPDDPHLAQERLDVVHAGLPGTGLDVPLHLTYNTTWTKSNSTSKPESRN